jgi:hypothetical protein
VTSAVLRRVQALEAWGALAPRAVHDALEVLLRRPALSTAERSAIQTRLQEYARPRARHGGCLFPVLAQGPGSIGGGLLTVLAQPADRLAAPGAERAAGVFADAAAALLDRARDGAPLHLHIHGRPHAAAILGRSATAAAWLAIRAIRTGRAVPPDIVVSADLFEGPAGPCLAAIDGAAEKARHIARECPGVRFFVCSDARVPDTAGITIVELPPGMSASILEEHVFGGAPPADRDALLHATEAARQAFADHHYASAGIGYAAVFEALAATPAQGEKLWSFEAALRLAAIAVHQGRHELAAAWFDRAEKLGLPATLAGPYRAERLASVAGMYIDAFRPADARAILDSGPAAHAAAASNPDAWARLQLLGSRRRLLLLDGAPDAARVVQEEILPLAEGPERGRALLDLALVALKQGDGETAARALHAAEGALAEAPPNQALQGRAFLAWYAGRLALAGHAGVAARLAAPDTIAALLADPALQSAPRWRLEALQAACALPAEAGHAALRALAAGCSPFQRWYLAVFLLEFAAARDADGGGGLLRALAAPLLADDPPDLAHMPALANARDRVVAAVRAGRCDSDAERIVRGLGAY